MNNDLNMSKSNRRFPDFIIAGAMKSGTTSLHHILANHPEIFIPDKEISFYDIDDFVQHPDFFFFNHDSWSHPKLEDRLEDYFEWYESFFDNAEEFLKLF